jgi:hypothetical protein
VVNAQLHALVEQAGRNLDTLELLTGALSPVDRVTVAAYKSRLRELQLSYLRETNDLTLITLQQAVERRYAPDRRVTPHRPVRPLRA